MLLARGWSQRRVALVLYGACALFGVSALFLVSDPGMKRTGLVLLVVGAVVLLVVERLRYHEVDEVKASMRRTFAERRLRTANNICVRRATRAMSQAATTTEIFSALEELLKLGVFVYANMQLGHNGNGNGNHKGHGLISEKKLPLCEPDTGKGLIRWSWQRSNIKADEIIGSGRFWTLRLPLSMSNKEWGYLNLYREIGEDALLLDINYLCDLFQRETVKAVEGVLAAGTLEDNESRVAQLTVAPLTETNNSHPPLMIARDLTLCYPDAKVA